MATLALSVLLASAAFAPQELEARVPLPKVPLQQPGDDFAGTGHRLVVKFVDEARVRALEDGTLRSLAGNRLTAFEAATRGLTFSPLVRLPEMVLEDLQRRAAARSAVAQPDLAGMVIVHGLETLDEMVATGNRLQTSPEVEFASIQSLAIEPPGDISPPTPDLSSHQTYLGPDPGIDAMFAWSVGATGRGLRLSDCEYGWIPKHEDAVDVRLNLEPGQTIHPSVYSNNWDDHGGAVIGETSAVLNPYGCRGIAPDAEVYTYPEWTVEEGSRRVTCITHAIADSAPGDVVLLEMQNSSGAPAEVDPAVWTVVKAGTDAGVVVVGAAGNGNENLDGGGYAGYRSRGDSGAIIVGAGTANTRHDKLGFSSYGARVNVQGWGESVFTLGYGGYARYGGDDNQTYTSSFSGTSSASPFVAASCISIQSYAEAHLQRRLGPLEIRDLLIRTGIPQGSGGHIGPFPDLEAALVDLCGPLLYEFPDELPDAIDPTGDSTAHVDVRGLAAKPLPGTGMLHVDDGSGWRSLAMTSLGTSEYEAVFPAFPGLDGGHPVRFYFSVDADDGLTHTHPVEAPTSTHVAEAWPVIVTVADLDFETPAGWTVQDTDPVTGSWERAVPSAGGDQGDPMADADGSGNCWVTGNAPAEDVDGGPTALLSPAYDLSEFEVVRGSYARWISGNGKRRLRISLSEDDGTSWIPLEEVLRIHGWRVRDLDVGAWIGLTDGFRLRAEIKDDPDKKITEAAFDRFRLEGVRSAMALAVVPDVVQPGDAFTFTTWKGTVAGPVLLFLASIDGVPFSFRLAQGSFDGAGQWILSDTVPNDPSLAGLDLGFRAIGLDAAGAVAVTAVEHLEIQ